MNRLFLPFAGHKNNGQFQTRFSSHLIQDLSSPITSNTSSQLLSHASPQNFRTLTPTYNYFQSNNVNQKPDVTKLKKKELTKVPLKESNRQLIPRLTSKLPEKHLNQPKKLQVSRLKQKLIQNDQPLKKVTKPANDQNQQPQKQNKLITDVKNPQMTSSKMYLSSKDFSKLGSSYFGESEGSFQQAKGTNSPKGFLASPILSPINNQHNNTPGKPPLIKDLFKKTTNFEINQQSYLQQMQTLQTENDESLNNIVVQQVHFDEKSPIQEQQKIEEQIRQSLEIGCFEDDEEIKEAAFKTLIIQQEEVANQIQRENFSPSRSEEFQQCQQGENTQSEQIFQSNQKDFENTLSQNNVALQNNSSFEDIEQKSSNQLIEEIKEEEEIEDVPENNLSEAKELKSEEQKKTQMINQPDRLKNPDKVVPQLGFYNFEIQIIKPQQTTTGTSTPVIKNTLSKERKKMKRSLQRQFSVQKRNQERQLQQLYNNKCTELRLQRLEHLFLMQQKQQQSCDLLGLNIEEFQQQKKEGIKKNQSKFVPQYQKETKSNVLMPPLDDSIMQPLLEENYGNKKSQCAASMFEELTNLHTRMTSSINSKEPPRIIGDLEIYNQNMKLVKQAMNEHYYLNRLSEIQQQNEYDSLYSTGQQFSIANDSKIPLKELNHQEGKPKQIPKVFSKSKLQESSSIIDTSKKHLQNSEINFSKNMNTSQKEPESKKKVYENTITLVQKKLQELKRNS